MRASGRSSTSRGRGGAGGGSQSATWKMSHSASWSAATSGRMLSVGEASLIPVIEADRLAEGHGRFLGTGAEEVQQDEGDGLHPGAHDGEGDHQAAVVDAEP